MSFYFENDTDLSRRFGGFESSSDDVSDLVFVDVDLPENPSIALREEPTSSIEEDDYVHILGVNHIVVPYNVTDYQMSSFYGMNLLIEPLTQPLIEPMSNTDELEPLEVPLTDPAHGLVDENVEGCPETKLCTSHAGDLFESLVKPLGHLIEPLIETEVVRTNKCEDLTMKNVQLAVDPPLDPASVTSQALKADLCVNEMPIQGTDSLLEPNSGGFPETPLDVLALTWAVSWDCDSEGEDDDELP
jgi:hypothetical protein